MSWNEHFERNAPEAFRVRKEMSTDSKSNEGEARPNLAEIRERLLCKRGSRVMKETKIHFQKAIENATRRKIYFASLLR